MLNETFANDSSYSNLTSLTEASFQYDPWMPWYLGIPFDVMINLAYISFCLWYLRRMLRKYLKLHNGHELAFFFIFLLWGPGDLFYLIGKFLEFQYPSSKEMYQAAQYLDATTTILSNVAEFIFVVAAQYKVKAILGSQQFYYHHIIDYTFIFVAFCTHFSYAIILFMLCYKNSLYGWNNDFPPFWIDFTNNGYVIASTFYTAFYAAFLSLIIGSFAIMFVLSKSGAWSYIKKWKSKKKFAANFLMTLLATYALWVTVLTANAYCAYLYMFDPRAKESDNFSAIMYDFQYSCIAISFACAYNVLDSIEELVVNIKSLIF